jgi:hypothetical protein
MERHARHDREWHRWPGRGAHPDARKGLLRGLFAPSDAAGDVAELIAARGRELEARSAQIRAAIEELELREAAARDLHLQVEQILRDGAAELDLRQAELSVRSAELEARETALGNAELSVDERRRALGAVELREAATERRDEALRLRERELEERARELADLARQLGDVGRTIGAAGTSHAAMRLDEHVALASVDGYRLHVRSGPPPAPGELVELEDGAFLCMRTTRSPLPEDDRVCAVLVPR